MIFLHFVHLATCFLALTSHSSIFIMTRTTLDIGASWTVDEVTFTATAVNVIQVDWTSANAKVGIANGYCSCLWYIKQ